MGKIRHVTMGDETQEKEQKQKAEARRQTKASKKDKPEDGDVLNVAGETEGVVVEASGKKSGEVGSGSARKKIIKIKIRSKRYQEVIKMVEKNKLYPLLDAISLVKQTSLTKFDGTVELHINLNPLALSEKGDKTDFRTTINLPHGTGKKINVVIADEKIIAEIAAGKINFDILVAHPSMMPQLAKVARILGPKGLMPNPKTGTVTPDPEKRVKELTTGQINIKTEPGNPIMHLPVGKVSFPDKQIAENISAVLKGMGINKIAKVFLTATMGPSVKIHI